MLALLMSRFPLSLAAALLAACGGASAAPPTPAPTVAAPAKPPPPPPVMQDPIIVVGAGAAGLAAAVEAAGAGARVVLIDRSTVFGGHAVDSDGGVAMVGTPLQQAVRLTDTPALAAEDLMTSGQDADEDWVRRYAERSRPDVYDWLTAMGVEFTGVIQLPGNRVARYHRTRDGGLGLVAAMYRNALALGVELRTSEDVNDLIIDEGRVVGVRTRGIRDGRDRMRRATAVILATGGFESDLERVRQNWPRGTTPPDRVLTGSGRNSRGDGIDLARQARAALHRMDHQWNIATGLPDPRNPDGERGLEAVVPRSIWLNRLGRRFVDENAGVRVTYPAVLHQPGGYFLAVVDADGARALSIAAPDWGDPGRIDREVLQNSLLVARGNDLRALARAAGIPSARLRRAVAVLNASGGPFRIERAPFYAIRLFPLARTSLGGVAVDENAQVVNQDGDPVPGLYAAGEVTGYAGINGRAALEGTLLGPSVLMGRIAGRSAAARATPMRPPHAVSNVHVEARSADFADSTCTRCHPIEALSLERTGWQHLAAAHRRVRAESIPCSECHADMYPYREQQHRRDRLLESTTCRRCHESR